MDIPLEHASFQFGEHAIDVDCRSGPDAQAGRTLTLQMDGAREGEEQGLAEDLTGLTLWPASLPLCRYLAAHPGLVAGKHVVELGAGAGLCGILACKLGAERVLLTDGAPAALQLARSNAARSAAAQRECECMQLDWARVASLPADCRGAWQLVLAADVLYASSVVRPFISALAALLHPDGGVALVAHQVRRSIMRDPATGLPRLEDDDAPLEAFRRGCAEAGLRVAALSVQGQGGNLAADPSLLLAVARAPEVLSGLPPA